MPTTLTLDLDHLSDDDEVAVSRLHGSHTAWNVFVNDEHLGGAWRSTDGWVPCRANGSELAERTADLSEALNTVLRQAR